MGRPRQRVALASLVVRLILHIWHMTRWRGLRLPSCNSTSCESFQPDRPGIKAVRSQQLRIDLK